MDDNQKQSMIITDINIPFIRLVRIIIKITLASMTATLIIALIMLIMIAIFTAIFGDSIHYMSMMPLIE